ncbi:hypothetical protein GF325_02305 [Candidatus Bathyarchaeota archaeon]|nr:hypothetical protein [Candidatus Bathyarchaeota archaeon]
MIPEKLPQSSNLLYNGARGYLFKCRYICTPILSIFMTDEEIKPVGSIPEEKMEETPSQGEKKSTFIDKIKNIFTFKKFREKESWKKKRKEVEKLWNEVGYHRITGGVFYSYILLIGGAIIGLVTVGIIAEFLPYPEINGYKGLVGSLLGFWFGLLDLNLGGGGSLSDSMGRFIGQYADTDPRRAMEYIRFYIWFQMLTGVAQVTVISLVAFTYLVNTNFAYLVWFILAQSLVQYPGMLMIMEDSLQAFQRGDKTAWLSWLQDTVFQVTINIVFLVLGRWWGASNEKIGELMGITIFYILSQFIDDWINLFIGAKMFNKMLQRKGIDKAFRSLLIPRFNKPIVIQCLKFVGKQWVGQQILGVIGYLVNLYLIIRTPQLASWSGLLLIPNFLGHLVSMVNWGSPTVPAVSESFNNGKEELARYFIHDMFKYWLFVVIFMAVPLGVLAPKILNSVIDTGLLEGGLENYQAGLVMIPIIMLKDATGQWRGWYSKIFVACDKPVPPIVINYIFTPSGYILQFLFLWLCVDLYILPIWFILFMPAFINDTMKAIVGYIWLQKKIIKIGYKKMAWQAFVAPALTAIAYALVLIGIQYTIWPLLDGLFIAIAGDIGPVITSFIFLLCILFLFPAVLMAPFYSLFGGWDDFTLEELRKTAMISGPSKGITMLIYKISAFFARLSPLTNKFPIADYKLVRQQIQELIDEGKANLLLGKKR